MPFQIFSFSYFFKSLKIRVEKKIISEEITEIFAWEGYYL